MNRKITRIIALAVVIVMALSILAPVVLTAFS